MPSALTFPQAIRSPLIAAAVALFAPALLDGTASAYDNGLARTPQMGWNTWNHYGCNINETVILRASHAIVDEGLDKLGYKYVGIDDCWQAAERDKGTGVLQADPVKFPSGIKNLTDQIHALGLKVGIYSSAGTKTCGGHVGSLDMEAVDARTWASWGIDLLKYDNCYNQGREGTPLVSFQRYQNMSIALNETGRPMVYELCNWGVDGPWNWATEIAHSWRMSGDIYDNFNRPDDRCPCQTMKEGMDCKLPGYHCSVTSIIDRASPLGMKAGPGKWNDLDMLEIGNGGMTYDEYVTHFSMWALLKSPLTLGNDVTNMTDETRSIIKNKRIIDISQDPKGSPAVRIWKKSPNGTAEGDIQLWMGGLVNSSYVVALLNTSPKTQSIAADFKDVFVDQGKSAWSAKWKAFDLWKNTDQPVGVFEGHLPAAEVPSHGVKVYKLVPA